MHFTTKLKGVDCTGCGEEEVVWWWEDETEDTIEVYARCNACNRDFPKRFVSKSEDTSDGALREIAEEQVR